jgi:hypothetical protein
MNTLPVDTDTDLFYTWTTTISFIEDIRLELLKVLIDKTLALTSISQRTATTALKALQIIKTENSALHRACTVGLFSIASLDIVDYNHKHEIIEEFAKDNYIEFFMMTREMLYGLITTYDQSNLQKVFVLMNLVNKQ